MLELPPHEISSIPNRSELFTKLFPNEPKFRHKQLAQACFNPKVSQWEDLTSFPFKIREVLTKEIPWTSIKEEHFYPSKNKDTYKAILKGIDGKLFESVLMANRKGQWTICVSSQIGCAMKCNFCATGMMGFKRNLNQDEIIDQYRYWYDFLNHSESHAKNQQSKRISNIVFMGMGEPMTNYENVKKAINTWLQYTDLGPTRITVSTVGVLKKLEQLLDDPEWPGVRIAISLHSADEKSRKTIVPTTVKNFIPLLATWSNKYKKKLANRNRYLTFEYTLIHQVNDSPKEAKTLANYLSQTGVKKINLIPLNPVEGNDYLRSQQERIDIFKEIIKKAGYVVTQRKTMGNDIAAACGQLATSVK